MWRESVNVSNERLCIVKRVVVDAKGRRSCMLPKPGAEKVGQIRKWWERAK